MSKGSYRRTTRKGDDISEVRPREEMLFLSLHCKQKLQYPPVKD